MPDARVLGARGHRLGAADPPRSGDIAVRVPERPGFARCESQDPVTGCTDNEQWNLYGPMTGDTCKAPGGAVCDQPRPDGGLPCWAQDAHDPEHAAGVNITGAWAPGQRRPPDILVAYIEGGVNYARTTGSRTRSTTSTSTRASSPTPRARTARTSAATTSTATAASTSATTPRTRGSTRPARSAPRPFVDRRGGHDARLRRRRHARVPQLRSTSAARRPPTSRRRT